MYQNVVSCLARIGLFAAVILFSSNLHAASSVTLAWNASTSPNITGYTVKYGTASGSHSSTLNAGTALTAAISTLTAGTRYYFVVTARNSAGLESDPSNEISYTPSGTILPNVLPTLDAIGNLNISEDAAQQTVSLAGITAGLGDLLQVVSVSATSSNPSLIPDPAVTYASPNTTGSLRFTPAVNATGTATITVTVNDSQLLNNLFSRSFTVTVNPVNDAPTLNAPANLYLGVVAARQTISLSGISSGAANENQSLSVSATSSNPGLIPTPTVSYTSPSATGSLSFTPTTGATGTSTITVSINDGQAQNNIVARSFTVTVSATSVQTIYVEAETGTRTTPMSVGSNTGAANGQYVYSTTAEQGTLSVPVNIAQAGNYLVWGRVLSPDNGRDSFYVRMDGGAEQEYHTAPNSWSGAWQWTRVGISGTPAIYSLTPGAHTLVFRCREAQTYLDALYITSDANFVPGSVGGGTPNVAPTLNTISNLIISEDAAQQTVNLSGIGTGSASESQTLGITAVSSNPALIPNPTVTYTSPNATGSLRFTPVANASGSATVTVTVNDGQSQNNTVSRTFTVTVNPVNDAPTLNAINNVSLAVNAVRQTISLAGIGSGAANESQTLAITAASSNTGLIPSPAVSYVSPGATGSVSFTPVANATGTATITVTVNDGQSQNYLFTRTFIVTVTGTAAPVTQTLFVEAETGTRTGTIVLGSDAGASAGNYVYCNSYNSGSVSFTFNAAKAGDYWVWCRVISPDASHDSFYVSMDGGANETYNTSPNTWSQAWQWTKVNSSGTPRTYTLAAGNHTLVFRNREMSTFLDALYITNDRNFVPPPGSGITFTAAGATEPDADNTTIPAQGDLTAPVISDLEVIGADARTITLAWRTDERAFGQIGHGTVLPLNWNSPVQTNFATDGAISLTNLEPGTDYLVQVQSADASGNVSKSDIGRVATPGTNNIARAAESGTLIPPMKVRSNKRAAGRSYVSSTAGGKGSAVFHVPVRASSDYTLWCRIWLPKRSTGSFLITINGGDGATFHAAGDGSGSAWRWVRATERPLRLDAGDNQLGFHVLQPGIWLDELVLSNDPDWAPAD